MNRNRRAVLKGVALLTGGAFGSTASAASNGPRTGDDPAVDGPPPSKECPASGGRSASDGQSKNRRDCLAVQQVDTELPPGVTLFDLNDDGEYAARVERAPEMADDDHPRPIHVTSGGQSTVDYVASIVAPPETTLGGLEELSYEYFERQTHADSGASAPGETFVVVENADGRHGMYHAADSNRPAGQWHAIDVLARIRGGPGEWFEYTAIESGYDGETFTNVVGRFGADARLVRVGVGVGNAVTPVTLDAFYDDLTVDGRTTRFPTRIVKRASRSKPV